MNRKSFIKSILAIPAAVFGAANSNLLAVNAGMTKKHRLSAATLIYVYSELQSELKKRRNEIKNIPVFSYEYRFKFDEIKALEETIKGFDKEVSIRSRPVGNHKT